LVSSSIVLCVCYYKCILINGNCNKKVAIVINNLHLPDRKYCEKKKEKGNNLKKEYKAIKSSQELLMQGVLLRFFFLLFFLSDQFFTCEGVI